MSITETKTTELEFLSNIQVQNFIKYLTDLLDGNISFKHIFYHKKNRINYTFNSINDAFTGYHWNGTYEENKNKLDKLQQSLSKSLLENNQEQFAKSAIEVLKWGGVLNGNQQKIEEFVKSNSLLSNFKLYCTILSKKNILKNELADVPMNSGFTKIYSLLIDNFIIYDSRVGAALGLLVKDYLIKNNQLTLPKELNFAYGLKKGELTTSSRNPSTRQFTFDKLSNNNILHSINNIRANWILKSAINQSSKKVIKNLRELESALFMIGYAVNETEATITKYVNKEKEERKDELSVWNMLKIAAENLSNSFSKQELKSKVKELYSALNDNTIDTYITACCVNNESRKHYFMNKKPRVCNLDYDFLYKNIDGSLEIYNSSIHGLWEIILNTNNELKIQQQAVPKKENIEVKSEETFIDSDFENIKTSQLLINEIPSGQAWKVTVEFALKFQMKDIENLNQLLIDTEEFYWEKGTFKEEITINDLRIVLKLFVKKHKFDTFNPPIFKDEEFMKKIVQEIRNQKLQLMWEEN